MCLVVDNLMTKRSVTAANRSRRSVLDPSNDVPSQKKETPFLKKERNQKNTEFLPSTGYNVFYYYSQHHTRAFPEKNTDIRVK